MSDNEAKLLFELLQRAYAHHETVDVPCGANGMALMHETSKDWYTAHPDAPPYKFTHVNDVMRFQVDCRQRLKVEPPKPEHRQLDAIRADIVRCRATVKEATEQLTVAQRNERRAKQLLHAVEAELEDALDIDDPSRMVMTDDETRLSREYDERVRCIREYCDGGTRGMTMCQLRDHIGTTWPITAAHRQAHVKDERISNMRYRHRRRPEGWDD